MVDPVSTHYAPDATDELLTVADAARELKATDPQPARTAERPQTKHTRQS
jgi:hypothetical protein